MTDTSWYPGNYIPDPAYPPHYRTMPGFLRIEDAATVQMRSKPKRLSFWQRCRDSALLEWSPTGLVTRVRTYENPKYQPYGPDRVTLNIADTQTGGKASHCFEVCPPIDPDLEGADWVHVSPEAFEQCYLARNSGLLRYFIAHEFGHSLGFGHGGDGIMDETPDHAVVNEEEITVMKDYWGT